MLPIIQVIGTYKSAGLVTKHFQWLKIIDDEFTRNQFYTSGYVLIIARVGASFSTAQKRL